MHVNNASKRRETKGRLSDRRIGRLSDRSRVNRRDVRNITEESPPGEYRQSIRVPRLSLNEGQSAISPLLRGNRHR